MPELPDLAILRDAFAAALVGRPVLGVAVREPLVVRATPAELEGLAGQHLLAVARRGKFLSFAFERDRIVINPMLTGRLGLAESTAKAYPSTAFVISFGPRSEAAAAEARAAGADWTRAATWLPPDGRPLELRYRDPTRMGKLYLIPAGATRAVAGWDEQGPDADDPALDLATWRQRIARHGGELKNLLKNQGFVAGIGNGYSDEILWAARLAPFRKRSTIAAEEIDRLYEATRDTLVWAVDTLRGRVPPNFEVEVRDFLRVHRKGGQPCPRCGARLTQVEPGGFVTTYCRTCQR